MRRFSLIALLAVGLAGCAQLAAPELPPPPAGYRLSHYRAPTPAELPGAQRWTPANWPPGCKRRSARC